MKVQKSSAECAAHNLNIKAEIDLGLSEAWEPSEQILAAEAAEAARKAAGFKLAADKLEVLKRLDPNTDGNRVMGVSVYINAIYTGASNWSSGRHTGWKLEFNNTWSDDYTWLKIGDGVTLGINAKQLEKAKAKLDAIVVANRVKSIKASQKLSEQARTEAFIKNNPRFCELAGHNYHNSGETLYYGSPKRAHYQTAFLVTEDESVRIGSETYSVAQWLEIFELREAQRRAMNALKASFGTTKPLSPAS